MKFEYSKLKIRSNLFLTIVWTFISVVQIYYKENIFSWWSLLFLFLIIVFWTNFIFILIKKYFEIDDDKIVLMGLRNKTIEFKNLSEIKFYGGEYVFKDSRNNKIEISKQWINEKKIPLFDERFQKLKNDFENKNQNSLK